MSDFIFNNQREIYRVDTGLIIRYSDIDRELIIKNVNGQIECVQSQKTTQQYSQPIKLEAIYGIIPLKQLSYLVVVNKSTCIGQIMNRQVYLADQFDFIPIEQSKIHSSDSSIIKGIQQLFATKTFYFSETYDLSNSLQRQAENKGIRKPIPHFAINYEYGKILRFCNPELWIPIFISGLVVVRNCTINNSKCQIMLISRRDYRRMGRRFISRGADLDGNCSNFAETEQIFTQNNTYYSYLQIRGSMPFRWTQKPDLKWAPKGKLMANDTQNLQIALKHFNDQIKFGIQKLVLVNLIDKKGNQKELGEYYQKMIQQLQNQDLKYVWFDFHHECRGMKYQNIQKLIDSIKTDIQYGEYFCMEFKQENSTGPLKIVIKSNQRNIIRTNCIDCLDRTNVVQSVFARENLWTILQSIGVIKQGSQAQENLPDELEQIFRDIWTKNADTISVLYTGTGALKTDSTKKGKRTKLGAIQDGYRSIKRYFIGNFYDGQIQNNIDILTHKIDVKKDKFKWNMFANWQFLIIMVCKTTYIQQFCSIGYLSYIGSHHIYSFQQLQDYLKPSEQYVSQENRKLIFQIGCVAISVIIMRSLIFKKHNWFVQQSHLNH